ASITSPDQVLVGGLVHQAVELRRIGELHLEEPRPTGRILVDEPGVVRDLLVDLHDLAVERGANVRGRLDAFDDADLVTRGYGLPGIGQFDEDDIAELFGGVLGDADDDQVALGAEPFVIFGVLHGSGPYWLALVVGWMEGKGRDDGGQAPAAHVAIDGVALGEGRGKIGHRHRRLDRRAEPARGDAADGRTAVGAGIDLGSLAHRRPAFRPQPHTEAHRPVRQFLQDARGAGEPAFAGATGAPGLLDRPGEVGLHRCRRRVDVV